MVHAAVRFNLLVGPRIVPKWRDVPTLAACRGVGTHSKQYVPGISIPLYMSRRAKYPEAPWVGEKLCAADVPIYIGRPLPNR